MLSILQKAGDLESEPYPHVVIENALPEISPIVRTLASIASGEVRPIVRQGIGPHRPGYVLAPTDELVLVARPAVRTGNQQHEALIG